MTTTPSSRSEARWWRQQWFRATSSAVGALAVWAGLIAVGRVWGMHLEADGRNVVLFTPPVLAGYRIEPASYLWIAVLTGFAAVAVVPELARRLSWSALPWVMAVASLGWAVGLAGVDGVSGLTDGLGWDTEYAPFLSRVSADPLGFLSAFVGDIKSYSIQIRGHPPGFVLVLGLLDRIGLRGPGWATAVVLVVAASAVAAVLLVVRDVAGVDAARRAAPFVAVAPAALWIATSLDAFFVGVTAWSVACIVLAARRSGCSRAVLAVVGGLLAGFALMLSYGLVLMAAIVGPLLWTRRKDRATRQTVMIAAATAAAALVTFLPAGFWWPAGLAATREEYLILGLDRPYAYFLVNNLSAWALAAGPAIAVGLAWLRDRRVWLLVGGALAAAIIADLSGMSSGEVERIWLPFTVWLLVAGTALGARRFATHAWLLAQVGLAIFITSRIHPLW